jgi:hypothetical protein
MSVSVVCRNLTHSMPTCHHAPPPQQQRLGVGCGHVFDMLCHHGRERLTRRQAIAILYQRNYVSRFLGSHPELKSLRHPHVVRRMQVRMQALQYPAGSATSRPRGLTREIFVQAASAAIAEFDLRKSVVRIARMLNLPNFDLASFLSASVSLLK